MANSVNKVILVGRLGTDPELKEFGSGSKVATFPLATNRINKNKEQLTDWHRVTIWDRGAEQVMAGLTKGALCCVEGRVSYRTYEKDGQKFYFTDVIANHVEFLSPRPGKDAASRAAGEGFSEQAPF